MARLRLFGQAGDAAGVREDVVDGKTVAAVLAAARARYGEQFAEVLARCRIWVNGDEVDDSLDVVDGDEIAILPPVSGGR